MFTGQDMIDIDIRAALTRPGEVFPFHYEGEPELPDFVWERPLRIDAEYQLAGDCLRVRGTLDAELKLQCSRCLADVAVPVRADFSEIFTPDAGDGETYAYDGETKSASLDQMVLDVLSTDLPIQILCREDCKGLCPRCGRDLNEGPCSCGGETERQVSQENPFAKLKDLF